MGLGGHINAKSYSDKNGPAARAREALELQIRLSRAVGLIGKIANVSVVMK